MNDSRPEVWSAFAVRSHPAYVFIDDSGEIDVHHGTLGEQKLDERIASLVSR